LRARTISEDGKTQLYARFFVRGLNIKRIHPILAGAIPAIPLVTENSGLADGKQLLHPAPYYTLMGD
jgi:hypothetical protein